MGHKLLGNIQGHGRAAHEHIYLRVTAFANTDLRIEAPFFKCLGGHYLKPERRPLALRDLGSIERGNGAPVMVFSETGLWVVAHPDENEGDAQQANRQQPGFFMSSSL